MLFCAAMGKNLTIAIVGAGSVGSALASSLLSTGHTVAEVIARDGASSRRRARKVADAIGAQVASIQEAEPTAKVVWLCVSDGAIRDVACQLARRPGWQGKIVFHSSGALSSDELQPLRAAGASVASVHPMMSFVRGAAPELSGVTFAIEGDPAALRVARSIVRRFNARVLTIRKQDKALYHALGAFASPLLVAELAAAERVAAAIGMSPAEARKTLAPMLRRTIENYINHGAAAAFSGPIVRGDVGTVRRHMEALTKVPHARAVYLELARHAVRDLPSANKNELSRLLGKGSKGR
ncbi:MAG TPA: Rossmann-like and DUF2520 domain-containing protein [Terriglobales bacterium]|nr:Rossmann-like and DUF2520 domain-containing protein [Terriglobales bacterium]